MREWAKFKLRENVKIRDIFEKFDFNGDGVLSYDEFETLLKSLDPKLKKREIVNYFRETLDG